MMYTGNYYPQEKTSKVPLDYVGNAFPEPSGEIGELPTNREESESVETSLGIGAGDSFLSRLSLGKLIPEGLKKELHLDKFKIGSEELLIAALALFLFLSKDGDKECAIILFLLLFVN